MRARTPEAALAVVLRLLVAQRLADTAGLPDADRQGVYEPQELAGSTVLDKLAKRVAPPSVKQHLAAAGGRARAARAGVAGRAGGAARGAAREARRRRTDPLRVLPPHDRVSRAKPPRRTATLVHAGDCEQQWGSADDDADDADEEALDEAA